MRFVKFIADRSDTSSDAECAPPFLLPVHLPDLLLGLAEEEGLVRHALPPSRTIPLDGRQGPPPRLVDLRIGAPASKAAAVGVHDFCAMQSYRVDVKTHGREYNLE